LVGLVHQVESKSMVDAGLLRRCGLAKDARHTAEFGHQRVDVGRAEPPSTENNAPPPTAPTSSPKAAPPTRLRRHVPRPPPHRRPHHRHDLDQAIEKITDDWSTDRDQPWLTPTAEVGDDPRAQPAPALQPMARPSTPPSPGCDSTSAASNGTPLARPNTNHPQSGCRRDGRAKRSRAHHGLRLLAG
jgi:hypothetical protein